MTAILIVDDELLVRISLKTLVPWQEHGFEIIGEAENGIEALSILQRQHCDIILTDIRMPELDGIELMNHVAVQWPLTKCLVLSNHNDFEYVQQALRLGAADYILKLSWEPTELLDKCIRIREVMDAARDRQTERAFLASRVEKLSRVARDKQLRDLFIKISSPIERDTIIKSLLESGIEANFRVVCIMINHYAKVLEENRFESEQLLCYTVANIMAEIIKKHGGGELVEVRNGKFGLLPFRFSETMLEELRSAVAKFASVFVSFGISSPNQQLDNVHDDYIEAVAALEKRFYEGESYLFYHSSSEKLSAEFNEFLEEEQLLKLFKQKQPEEILAVIANWHHSIRENKRVPPSVVREWWVQLLYLFNQTLLEENKNIYDIPSLNDKYPLEVVRNAETLEEIFNWFASWLQRAIEHLHLFTSTQYRPEIQTVLDIIQQEYHTALKVSNIAKRVGYAENYLSMLFKKETGMKMVDCIIQFRMKKARELLADPAYKIYEISEMVGYGDPNHFSKYFKKIEGVFPLDYRRQVLGKGK